MSGNNKESNTGADTKGGANLSRTAPSNTDASSARSGGGSGTDKVGYNSNTTHSGLVPKEKSNTPSSASPSGKDTKNNASSTSAPDDNAKNGAGPNGDTKLVTPVDQIIPERTSPPGAPRQPSRYTRDGSEWRADAERVQREGKELRKNASPR
jgi:hypothetical protein